jgi:hypothetical protein
MTLPETILNQMRCCLSDDGHIVHEPILLKCGLNACKKCVDNSAVSTLKCFGCNSTHEKTDLINAPISKCIESFIKLYLPNLFEDLNAKLKSTCDLLKCLNFDSTLLNCNTNISSNLKKNQ